MRGFAAPNPPFAMLTHSGPESILERPTKKAIRWMALLVGGSEDRFLKHLPEDLFADLELLYDRMVALGVEYRDGEVYLEDLNGKL